MDKIIEKIVCEMKSKGISATKLENDTGIGKNTISVWKRGTQPTVEKLIKVIKYLGLSADEVFEISSPINRTEKSLLISIAREDLRWIYKCLTVLSNETSMKEMVEDANGIKTYIERALEKYDIRDKE